jgi:hypothetical protein
MRYILLIYGNEATEPRDGSPEQVAQMAGYQKFGEDAGARGVLLGGERLRAVGDARTVRIRGGQTTASDGPFAETKEQLGGYYIVEAKNHQEACDLAAKIPGAATGSIEVRPIWEM